MTGVRAQVNLLVATTTAVVLAAFLAPLGVVLRTMAEQRAIADATARAQAAAALVAVGQTPRDDAVALTVFYSDGRVVGAAAERGPAVELASRGEAFAARTAGGVEVLVPVHGLTTGTPVVRVFVPDHSLHSGVLRSWLLLAAVGLALVGLSLLLADRLGRRLVGSVTALAATADRLAAGDLTVRAAPTGPPEIRRVAAELNRLATRIEELLQAEREEVASLAHRLRTPLTALRLDIDAVRDPRERARLGADAEALIREVDELIRTARRPVRAGVHPQADLVAVVAERTAFWSVLAEESGRALELDVPPGPVVVAVPAPDLAAALDALLDNVFSHTPDGAPVRVSVTVTGDRSVLRVEDGGPGLPAALADRGDQVRSAEPAGASTPAVSSPPAGSRGQAEAGDRTPATDGTRPANRAAGSTGLGLDIARRTAEAAGGTLRLGTSPLGGALIELAFPR
jgi:signal transduction histidine kinase